MRTRIVLPALTFALLSSALAATPPAQPTRPPVQGTTQLDGNAAKIGQTFTLGKASPVNFTLISAEYATGRVAIGGTLVVPKADEKLLVLRFTAHNPTKQDLALYNLTFTAVDLLNVNHKHESSFVRAGTSEEYRASLKPAQKIELVSVIRVPASGVVPKLIVQNGDGGVLRYDLRGAVKGVPAPFADARDASGATALKDAPAKLGVTYATGRYDMTFESVTFSSEALLDRTPPAGKRYVLATVALTNRGANDDSPSHYTFGRELLDADGEPVAFWILAKGNRPEEAINRAVKPGETYRVRLVFVAPADVGLRQLTVREGNGHGLVFDLGHLK